MAEIDSLEVLDFLKKNNIQIKLINFKKRSYKVSSIYQIEEGGFYFISDFFSSFKIKDSLILTDDIKKIDSSPKNAYIIVNRNPQEIFYRIISNFHRVKSSGIISDHSLISPNAKIGENVEIGPFCTIGNCQIGSNSIIKSNTIIYDNSKIGENNFIGPNSIIGAEGIGWVWDEHFEHKIIPPQLGGVEIKSNCNLGANTIIVRGSFNENSIIGDYTLMAPGCRIGHGSIIGSYVHFANNVCTGGNSIIGDFSFLGMSSVITPKVKLHSKTIVGAGGVVIKSTSKENLTLIGVPAKEVDSKVNPKGMPKPKI
jgi:UDP-3-O-[3-hydroxymyristoyl] glucosamine N-acyltransferase